ncbi:MAG: SH3 domain-containing protein [Endomicrobia bacterium]|nr:SH3 domain-containing protein [Endomicrobiia bacterium]
MKKFLSYLIVIAITYFISAYINNSDLRNKISSIFKKEPQEQIIKIMYVKPKTIYVRTEPLDNAEILGSLKRNAEVGLITTQDKWAKIKTPAGVSGWVLFASLKDTPPKQIVQSESAKKETKTEETQQEEIKTYQDLSSDGKIPSNLISAFEQTSPPQDELPDVIKEEIKKTKETPITTTKKTQTAKSQPQQQTSTTIQTNQPSTAVAPSTITVTTEQKEEKTVEVKKETKKKKEKIQQEQTDTPPQITNCSNCGAEVMQGERFCPICREPIKK